MASAFTGVCHQCGRCCEFEAADGQGRVRCGYLAVERHRTLDLMGQPWATQCTVYPLRYDGMPIPMHRVTDGTFYGWRTCAKDSAQEDQVIAQHIGRGCSLERAAGAVRSGYREGPLAGPAPDGQLSRPGRRHDG